MPLRIPVGTISSASSPSILWPSELCDGTYRNPILHADYSDPDAIRVDDDFWLVSSSFSHVPGLPILHSRDLVNWRLVAHALTRLVPEDAFATPQHGKGVWAPSIRHHAGKFWIYYADPDFGLHLVTATNPLGPWSKPILVKSCRGLIDPCPLWDDDESLYLIHSWAKSRAGFSNVLTLLKLSNDGTSVAEDLGIVVQGDLLQGYHTLEGPKLYRRDGWYYIFAPAGGVENGWQSVFRSRSIRGPYADRIVLAQGSTSINGPHQGALIDLPNGESWFLHFQAKAAYGRVVHLQPDTWRDGWPSIGVEPDVNGCGQPVLEYIKPAIPLSADSNSVPVTPASSDEFLSSTLGLQWQWQANARSQWYSLTLRPGWLRLFSQPIPENNNLYAAPYLLLQKFPALAFAVDTRLEMRIGSAGLIVFGNDYAWIGIRDGQLVQVSAHQAHREPRFKESLADRPLPEFVHLRVQVTEGALCTFAFSIDGETYSTLGDPFKATVAQWVGAKVGLFATGDPGDFADFDFFRVESASPQVGRGLRPAFRS